MQVERDRINSKIKRWLITGIIEDDVVERSVVTWFDKLLINNAWICQWEINYYALIDLKIVEREVVDALDYQILLTEIEQLGYQLAIVGG